VSPQLEKVDNSFADTQLPKSSAPLPLPIVSTAKELFAGATGLSGPQLFDFFANYSDDISRMRYGSDVPSRKEMFENFLESLAVDKQREAVLALCDGYSMKTPPDASACTGPSRKDSRSARSCESRESRRDDRRRIPEICRLCTKRQFKNSTLRRKKKTRILSVRY
jgi:hypothetical protein